MRRLTPILLAVLALLLPRAAAARGTTVTVDLRPVTGDTPTHVCVVTEARGPRNRRPLQDLLAPGQGPDGRRLVAPAAWRGGPADTPRACSDDPTTDCRPVVELPPGLPDAMELYAACTADTLASVHGARIQPRVLFLLLEQLEASPPDIVSVRLAGGIATVGVGTTGPLATFTVRSLGGHYEPHPRSFRAQRQPSGDHSFEGLAIEPRCHWIDVALPRTRLRPADRERLEVTVHGTPIDTGTCVGAISSEALRVLVARAPLNVGRLEVDLAPTADRPAARFGRRWVGPWPKTPLELELRQVSFSWRRPACIYPADACPRATLADGTVCAAEVTESGCAYTCPGTVTEATAVAVPLPTEVEFETTAPVQTWSDRLAQNGQTLSSYVPPENVFLDVDLSRWTAAGPGNSIRKIKFFRPDGAVTTFNVSNSPQLSVNLPHASCADVPFEVVGDRGYREGRAQVRSGHVDLGKPEDLAKVVSFQVAAAGGGGPAWSPLLDSTATGPPIFFGGLLQFSLNLRPRRPKLARLVVENRIGVNLGQWGAVVFEDDMGDVQESFRDFIWVRFLVGPGLTVDLTDRLALGLGIELGTSFPARTQKILPGIAFTFVASPTLDLRLRIRRYLSTFVQLRGVVDKAFQSDATTSAPNSNEPTTSRRTAGTLLTLFGLMAHF